MCVTESHLLRPRTSADVDGFHHVTFLPSIHVVAASRRYYVLRPSGILEVLIAP